MAKPYILALDDDPSVLRAVERDLKSQFGPDYRILAVDSPEKAIGFVRQLTAASSSPLTPIRTQPSTPLI